MHQISFREKTTTKIKSDQNILKTAKMETNSISASKLGPHILGEMFQIDTQIGISIGVHQIFF